MKSVTCLSVEFSLHSLVSLSYDVLAVLPATESRGSTGTAETSRLRSGSRCAPSAILAGSGGRSVTSGGDIGGSSVHRSRSRGRKSLLRSVTVRGGRVAVRGRRRLGSVSEMRRNVSWSFRVELDGVCEY